MSVVVPVYNPGPRIEPLIDSLDAQSLPAERFEAVFVDDGSTDGTPARLDRLAAERAHVTVIHQENSGWPGKPRNVGTDAARGEYVFYSDNDDWLGPEALERMYAIAARNRADIVIGKMAGHNRGVPRELFRRTVEDATLANTPLVDSLTPHKMFRRAFLAEQGIRFPEGRRRLEDHVFVMEAYFLAQRICVLSDYVCYHHTGREDAGNAGLERIDPRSYYGYVRETLDVVDRHTTPGLLQDRLLRRFLRQELLGRLDGPRLEAYDPAYRELLFTEIRRLALERFPETVDAGLPRRQRLLAEAVRAGDLDGVRLLVTWSGSVGLELRLDRLEWAGDTLEAGWSGQVAGADGSLLRTAGERLLLAAPPRAGLPDAALEVTRELSRVRADLVARRRGGADEVLLATTTEASVDEQGRLALAGVGRVQVGAPLADGAWDLTVRVRAFGWTVQSRLGCPAAGPVLAPAALVGPVLALPDLTGRRRELGIDLTGSRAASALDLRSGAVDGSSRAGTGLRLVLGARCVASVAAALVLRDRASGAALRAAARLAPTADGSELVAVLPVSRLRRPRRTRWELLLLPDGSDRELSLGADLVAAPGRGYQVVRQPAVAAGAPVPAQPRALLSAARRLGRRSWRGARRRLGRLARRLGLRRS